MDERELQCMAWHNVSRQTGRGASRQEWRKGVREKQADGLVLFGSFSPGSCLV